jgi:hypothetical protein
MLSQSARELYRPNGRSMSAKLVSTFAHRVPTAVNLSFIDRNQYFFFQVALQLSSRGWVGPVPDPLLLVQACSTQNRTRDHWSSSSQELWPLDYKGDLYINTCTYIYKHEYMRTYRNYSSDRWQSLGPHWGSSIRRRRQNPVSKRLHTYSHDLTLPYVHQFINPFSITAPGCLTKPRQALQMWCGLCPADVMRAMSCRRDAGYVLQMSDSECICQLWL